VREGDAISPFYDPMIAKLIVWGKDRDAALARMAQALSEYQIVGPTTNIAFLQRLITSKPFAAADLDTGLIERHQAILFPPSAPISMPALTLACVSLLLSEQERSKADAASDPWASGTGWRMNSALQRTLRFADYFSDASASIDVTVAYQDGGWKILRDGVASIVTECHSDAHDLTFKLDDDTVRGTVVRDGEVFHIFTNGSHTALTYNDPLLHAGQAETEGGRLTAPMSGKIVAVLVAQNANVEKGVPLLIMEAMKMEHTITAPSKGLVEEILYAVGDQVAEGAQLLSFKPIE
jgi:3-methylcrotonyl-CoA carboxylase alpha subunit